MQPNKNSELIYLLITACCVLNFKDSVFAETDGRDGLPLVRISQGILKGLTLQSRSNSSYSAFFGIPYVNTPNRFEPPDFDRLNKWDGVRDATAPGPRCLQYDAVQNKTFGEEDCLFMNVYTPQVRGKLLPVMVYIHGGGFQWGAGHIHGAKYFMDEQVVLVTFNYRLGPFGFLSTGDVVQGNMGLKDQVAALKWVKANIKDFGGNPDLVTIFGESAGAAAVSLILVSAMSKDLFKHAISQSGASLNPWACLKNPKLAAMELGEKLDCPIDDSSSLIQCLKSKSGRELASHSFAKWYIDPTVPFSPVVEKLLPGQSESDVFLSQSPFEILSAGKFNKVPWITGINEDEGIYFHSSSILKEPQLTADVNKDWNRIAPYTLTFYEDENVSQDELNSIGTAIKDYYFKGQQVDEKTRQELTNMYSDRFFVHGVRSTALLQASQNSFVYPYIFTFEGSFSFLQQRGFEKGLGVTHKDDLQYFFDGIAPEPKAGRERHMSEQLVKLWVNFATTGKPNATWGSETEWKAISMEEATGKKPLEWLRIDENPEIINEPFTDRMKFWDHLMTQHDIINFPQSTNIESNKNETNLREEL